MITGLKNHEIEIGQIEEMQRESGIRSDDAARGRSREVMKYRQVDEATATTIGLRRLGS